MRPRPSLRKGNSAKNGAPTVFRITPKLKAGPPVQCN